MQSKITCNPDNDLTAAVPDGEMRRWVVVTFVVGVALQLAAVLVGVREGGMLWLGLTMWAPTMGTLAAGPRCRALAWQATRRLSWRWWGAGLLIGFAPKLLQTTTLMLTGLGTWQHERFELTADGGAVAAVHGVGMLLGTGPQSFPALAANLALTLVVSAVLVAIVGGIGEEVGWRGVLQPVLERRQGRVRGTVVVGLLWAAWHLPANLAGYNDAQHPVWSALVFFPLAVVAMSFSFAWLRARSASVWPVALAHGANNTLGDAFLFGTTDWATNTALEVLSMALVAVVVVLLLRRRPWPSCRNGDVTVRDMEGASM